MTDVPTRVLIVDDDRVFGEMVAGALQSNGCATTTCTSARTAIEQLASAAFDVVVTDVRIGRENGLELTAHVREHHPELPVIVITAFGDLETAIAAIRAGAHDFVPKPFDVDELALRVRRAAEFRSLRAEVRRLRDDATAAIGSQAMLGKSDAMRRVFALVERVAPSDASILVTGETGTGKELVARALHDRSRRGNGPFIAINCSAMPENLLESELFGHAKGAFTDAREARPGLFVRADKGTLFLDEIGDMPLALQAKLLRALQERKVRPVGSDHEVPFDARILSATHRDLEARIAEGAFREDLYYRLNVVQVDVPPLRSRGSDMLLLAQAFLERFAARDGRSVRSIDPECARRLVEYPWPGNVRELQNAIERAVALAPYDAITVGDLPERLQRHESKHVVVASDDPSELVSLEEVEKRYILRVLEATHGHRTRAAQVLGLDRKTLYHKLKSYGLRESQAAGS